MSHLEQNESQATRWQVPFFTIWIGQQVSLIGSMLAGFALVWWLTRSTGSATVLATASLVQTLPRILLGPFAGALVDRWNRRKVMLVADSVIALSTAILAYLFWTEALRLWHVYVLMTVGAIGGTFHWPAMSASTSLMVPKEHLARVAGINQAMNGVLSIISPPLGALLISILPLHGVMAVDVLTAAFAIAPLFFVHVPQPERRIAAGAVRPTLWADMREGFDYVWSWAGLRRVMLIAVVLNFLLNPAGSLTPLLVTQHFSEGAPGLALLQSLWGGGAVLGGLLLSVWGGFRRRILTSMLGLAGMGAGALFLGLAPAGAFWMGLAGMHPIVVRDRRRGMCGHGSIWGVLTGVDGHRGQSPGTTGRDEGRADRCSGRRQRLTEPQAERRHKGRSHKRRRDTLCAACAIRSPRRRRSGPAT
jgi:DHA3 family macrolide efflux protein-like MFS transporter